MLLSITSHSLFHAIFLLTCRYLIPDTGVRTCVFTGAYVGEVIDSDFDFDWNVTFASLQVVCVLGGTKKGKGRMM